MCKLPDTADRLGPLTADDDDGGGGGGHGDDMTTKAMVTVAFPTFVECLLHARHCTECFTMS